MISIRAAVDAAIAPLVRLRFAYLTCRVIAVACAPDSTVFCVFADDSYFGHQFADYALLLQEGPPLRREPAKDPSQFISYRNGYDTYFCDPDFYPPVRVY